MSNVGTAQRAEQMAIDATVIRCGCGRPAQHAGQVCPRPNIENLGTVSYYHRNPLKRLTYYLKRRVRPALPFWVAPSSSVSSACGLAQRDDAAREEPDNG